MNKNLFILIISLLILNGSVSKELLVEQSKKKILVAGQHIASHPRIWYLISKELKKNENYEVYQILPSDSPLVSKVKTNGVIPILSKNLSQQVINEYDERMKANTLGPSGILEYMQYLTKVFYSQDELIKEIKSLKFDLIICGLFFESQLIANTLQIPLYIRIITGNLDSSLQVMMNQHTSHSSQLHLAKTTIFGMEKHENLHSFTTNFFTRLRNRLSEHVFCGFGSYFIHQKLYQMIPDNMLEEAKTLRTPDMILYTGYEGLYPPIALSPNSKIISPLSEDTTETQDIPKDLEEFINRHDKLILVSFGSVQSPTNQTLSALSIYMQKQSNYGFIYSARNQKYLESDILERIKSLKNVYLANWLPQTYILSNPKVKIFFSHGGQSSYIESIEAVKPLIVIPAFANDQFFTCEYVQAIKIGACMYKPDASHLEEIVKYVEDNNGFIDRLQILKKMIEKKKQQGLGMRYWVDYLMEVGTSEFISARQYQWFNYLQLYDVDVNITIDLILVAILAIVFAILIKIYRFITCKKSKMTSKSIKAD
ncbi:antennal-enriched udp-glycosyltransferase [Stylonychia lemnae]|uniref:Antennal-enriched udp-glycosyltransferase n=1 Tax=Stylonychia lemnae TaxID=5949 RepID=A0A078AY26_STYLE|nr:antennal-enriched udp-glycosyltransferase [Stylonychia lemnae]|eukprot:CDW86117.1 antennal-enriched udp-glycosyltransferase [Stylonychia lemnae]